MSYKRYLFETGGYVTYEYAKVDAQTAADEKAFADIHNNLRAAATSIVGMSTTLAAVMRHGAYNQAQEGAGSPNFSAINEARSLNSADSFAHISSGFAKTPFVFIRKEGKDTIVLKSKPIETRLVVNPLDKDQERLIQQLFPGYAHPKEWEKPERSNTLYPKVSFGKLTSDIDAATAKKLLSGAYQSYVPAYVLNSSEAKSSGVLPKGMGVSLSLTMDVSNLSNTRVYGLGAWSVTATGGALPSNAAVAITVTIQPELHIPTKYAYWATYADSEDEFVPFLFMTHISSLVRASIGAVGDKHTPAYVGELKGRQASAWKKAAARKPTPISIDKRNKAKEAAFKFQPRIKTDANGFIITPGNDIIRLPTEGKMREYQSASKAWFEALSEEDVSNLTNRERGGPRFKFEPSVLYVDHHNEVLVYTTQEGTVTSLNLRGSRPLDNITIVRRYSQAVVSAAQGTAFSWEGYADKLSPEGALFQVLILNLFRAKANNLLEAVALGSASQLEGNPIIREFADDDWYYLSGAANGSLGYGHELSRTISGLAGSAATSSDEDAINSLVKIIISGGRDFAGVVRQAYVDGKIGHDDGAVLNKLAAEANMYIIAKHYSEIPKYAAERMYNRRHNLVEGLDRSKPIKLPNIDTKKLQFLFPHQAEFVQNIDGRAAPPTLGTIGAQPGGGKSICIIADILILLNKGKIKRPVIAVPNNLVKQFVEEINTFSNGRVNAYPLTYQHVQKVMMAPNALNMSTSEYIDHLRNLPPNTIIVVNYNTLKNSFSESQQYYANVGSYDNFGNARELKAFPFVEILVAAGVDYVCGDESHKTKNADTEISQAFLSLCAHCEYARISSGTTINNIVTDLVGQYQKLNPAILGGDPKEFAADYLGDENAKQITDFQQGLEIKEAIHDYGVELQRDSRSWDYMLPPMRETIHRIPMTPLQDRYYNILFSKALNIITEEVGTDIKKAETDDNDKLNNKIERAVAKHFIIIDRFVNDPTQFPDFVDGSFVYEEYKIINGVDAAEGSLQLAIPKAEDLISVKAVYTYNLLYAHMDEKGKLAEVRKNAKNFLASPDHNVIVMAPNKFVGNHIWNNMPSDLKSRAVRYQAGGAAEVEAFKTDPKVKFMIADETSITEGYNLQRGNLLIRVQQVFTPGAETQALARIRRPDPFDKYSRDSLGYDILVTTKPNGKPTIDDLRTARLLAKKFNNALVEFGFDPTFRKQFVEGYVPLPPIKLSMDNIKGFPEALLEEYFDQQSSFNTWFNASSREITKQVGREAEIRLGKKLLDDNGRPINSSEFIRAVVVPTEEAGDMAGSATSYVPWMPGAEPINPLGFAMQPVRSFVSKLSLDDDDDDSEDTEDTDDDPDNVEIKVDDHVMTEFGPGIVSAVPKGENRNNWLSITIPSLSMGANKAKKFRLPKTCVYVPLDKDGAKILAQALSSKTPNVGKPPKPKAITPQQRQQADDRKRGGDEPEPDFLDYDQMEDFDVDDFDIDDLVIEDDEQDDEPEDPIDVLLQDDEDQDEDEDEQEEEEDGAEPTIFAQAFAINGMLAIVADDTASGAALDRLYTQYGFKPFPDMVRVEFKTRKALDTFLAKLTRNGYAIPRPNQQEIDTIAVGLTSRGKLHQLQPFNYAEITNFMRTEQRRVPKRTAPNAPQIIRLYPIVFNGKFYLCGSVDKHPFPITRILNKAVVGIPGAGKPQEFDNMGVKFYSSMSAAKSDAKKLIKDGTILEDSDALLESFDAIRGGHISVNTVDQKPAAVITNTKPKPTPKSDGKPTARQPMSMDGSKPKATKPQITTYKEEKYNPGVEDITEFRNFLRQRRPTLVYVRGGADIPKGVPLRVVAFGRNTFSVAERPDTPKDDYLSFSLPTEAVFDAKAGTMKVGNSLWRLSYAG